MKTIEREEIQTRSGEPATWFLWGRWFFFASMFLTVFFFARSAFDSHLYICSLALFFLNLLMTGINYVSPLQEGTNLYRAVVFIGYVADSLFLALLIAHTGGFTSPFVLGYACLVSNISEHGLISDILIYGVIFHLSFAYAIYSIYQNWAVYFSPQVLMVTVLFTFFSFRAVYLARRIHQQAIKLQRSKLALEHFAEELKSSNKNIERISYLDPVTGLYNFRYFRQRLAEELDRAGRYQSYLSLLIIDVDNFKSYNELFGHQKGDKVLSEIGKIIKNNTREVDVLARYIGDEFALALVDADADLAVLIANRIKKAVEEHRFPGEEEIPESKLTVSIGIAVYPENAQTMEGLIKKAENALHKVKLSRRNRIRVYSNIFEEIRSELGDSEKLIDTLQTLLVVVNARDRYTYGHSERVMRYALALGRRLGLDSETLKQLKYGAFLHDIGKIEIDREVLNKKEPLTDEEWELIKEHPRFGVSILESIRGLEDILDIVKYHHERYDGRGYPDGLQGEEIPLCARILAVADSFDAMTSNRPYRDALPKEVALKELERGKGLQFDPQVVEAFFDVVDEVEKEIEDLAG